MNKDRQRLRQEMPQVCAEEKAASQFIFRSIRPSEAEEAIEIEQICFPPNEACSPASMRERIAAAPELFLVVEDGQQGRLAGVLNGIATEEARFRDEFFTDASLHQPSGRYVMLLGLDVRPEYRGRGLARALVQQYIQREQANGRQALILTCLQSKVEMYKKFGFVDLGIANSTWGGEEWHEMRIEIGRA